MKKSLLWLGCCCAVAGAWAEPLYRPQFQTCLDQAVSTADNIRCVQTETAFQDGRLNRVYRALMDSYPPEKRRLLQQAQRGWNVYKDNSSRLIGMNQGSLYRVEAAMHYLTLTTTRAQELEAEHKMAQGH